MGRGHDRVPDQCRQAVPDRDPRPVPSPHRRPGRVRQTGLDHRRQLAADGLDSHRKSDRSDSSCQQWTDPHLLDLASNAGNGDDTLSFRLTGDEFDNAAMEILWARLKVEVAWIRGSIWFATRAGCHADLFKFIEAFFNRQRHQTGLDHLSAAEYADNWHRDRECLDLS
jgi:hypothetical protein